VVIAARQLRGGGDDGERPALLAPALAAAMFACAVLAYATGSVGVEVGRVVVVNTEKVLWPAYAGLALAATALLGAALVAAAALPREGRSGSPTPHGA
jgi:hypothetical protein